MKTYEKNHQACVGKGAGPAKRHRRVPLSASKKLLRVYLKKDRQVNSREAVEPWDE